MTTLITGGAGFIGSNFARAFVAARTEPLVILDALTYAGNLASIRDLIDGERVKFVKGDICDSAIIDDVFTRYDVARVVHFAAETHVDRSILGPRAFIETNVRGTLNLLMAAHKHWQNATGRRLFLQVSTDEVYGALRPADPPFDERSAYAPSSPYAASKAAADHLVRAWHNTYGLPIIITNCTNNYGPWQFPEKLIPLSILSAAERKELPLYGDGLQVRDWLHVDDHCDALLAVIERGARGETYCIGGGNQRSNLEVVTMLCDLVDANLDRAVGTARKLIRHVVDRPGHDRRYAIDAGKLQRELGWSPRQDFVTALPTIVQWYLAHADWVATIRSGEYRRFYAEQYGDRLRTTS